MNTTRLYARAALLPTGWTPDVVIDIDRDGTIVASTPGRREDADQIAPGPVICGMPNVHSHAFQRALVGHTGPAAPHGADSFWTWRTAMYRFLDRIDPDAFEAIAAQAYVEMAKSGYTTVGEFHYVHRDPRGATYGDLAELALRTVAAAGLAGVRLTLLPVFYAHGGFGAAPPAPGQRRFLHDLQSFGALFDVLSARSTDDAFVLGVAPHSLRAVTPEELREVVAMTRNGPIHIHAAEQTREVDECVAWSGRRPVEWLLRNAGVNARWCIVHATHMTGEETDELASSGATVGLASTTEADLGDGIFPADRYVRCGGSWGIGTDSNTIVDPFVELRQLEWSQRLHLHRRNVLAPAGAISLGVALWNAAAQGGSRALAQPAGAIAPGHRADLVVLNTDDPALAEQPPERILDAAIFGPCRAPVRDVMSGGRWIVRDGRHMREEEIFDAFRRTLARLDAMPPET